MDRSLTTESFAILKVVCNQDNLMNGDMPELFWTCHFFVLDVWKVEIGKLIWKFWAIWIQAFSFS